MGKRKSTGKRQRFEVFKRDRFTCQYCGRTPPTIVLELDHIVPVAGGGGNEDTNLITACEDCNAGKAARPLTEVPRAIEIQLAEQIERREQLEAYNEFLMEARRRDDDVAIQLGHYWFGQIAGEDSEYTFGSARIQSVKLFLRRMPTAEVYEAIDIALSRVQATLHGDTKAWKYFCGVCWKKIREREGTGNG